MWAFDVASKKWEDLSAHRCARILHPHIHMPQRPPPPNHAAYHTPFKPPLPKQRRPHPALRLRRGPTPWQRRQGPGPLWRRGRSVLRGAHGASAPPAAAVQRRDTHSLSTVTNQPITSHTHTHTRLFPPHHIIRAPAASRGTHSRSPSPPPTRAGRPPSSPPTRPLPPGAGMPTPRSRPRARFWCTAAWRPTTRGAWGDDADKRDGNDQSWFLFFHSVDLAFPTTPFTHPYPHRWQAGRPVGARAGGGGRLLGGGLIVPLHACRL